VSTPAVDKGGGGVKKSWVSDELGFDSRDVQIRIEVARAINNQPVMFILEIRLCIENKKMRAKLVCAGFKRWRSRHKAKVTRWQGGRLVR